MLRYASIFLLLLLCLTALPQPPDRSNPDVLKRFHDDALNITYFYPSRFARLPFPPATALTLRHAQVCAAHPIRQLHHPDRHLLVRPLHCRQHVPGRLALRHPARPFHPREDPEPAQTVWRTEHHPRTYQLHNRWPCCRHHLSLRYHARDFWQRGPNYLRSQGLRVGQHSSQAA